MCIPCPANEKTAKTFAIVRGQRQFYYQLKCRGRLCYASHPVISERALLRVVDAFVDFPIFVHFPRLPVTRGSWDEDVSVNTLLPSYSLSLVFFFTHLGPGSAMVVVAMAVGNGMATGRCKRRRL